MDQHIPKPVSQRLRRHGVDILTAQQAVRCGLPDQDQLVFATAENRVIVTFDADYLAIHQAGVQHGGIAWRPAQKYSIGQLIQALLLLHGVLDRDAFRNHIEYL
jgi:hypothetical protein